MAKVELRNFPTGRWEEGEFVQDLQPAERFFHQALQVDPHQRTTNDRLGTIAMMRRDYQAAASFLNQAYQANPGHRGIVKSLGYSYTWIGEFDRAQALLVNIPEAGQEMGVYVWWWQTQGRNDLAEKAGIMANRLKDQASGQ
jgi:tetratricopeptide (TPR) repeat protein